VRDSWLEIESGHILLGFRSIAEKLKVCNDNIMTKIIHINARGTLTLPKEARRELGLSGAGQIVVESTEDGLLLRPGVTFPIEIYSQARVAELKKSDAKLAPYATRIKAALRGKPKTK
jgi:AbrB family looped-hinge helix DNA binding protein